MTAKLADVFPAHVAVMPAEHPLPVGELTSAPNSEGSYKVNTGRIIVTNERVMIFRDSPNGPVLSFNQEIDPDTYSPGANVSEDSRIVTRDGIKLAWRKDTNCGCGSRLRSLNPSKFVGHVGSSKDHTE